ncbi:hypothetical protein B0H12DRAFT_1145960 [Mycena haematopus]|nr:hypothetical protein B0H12DRAFT_1145960 [Mycena haematopus]
MKWIRFLFYIILIYRIPPPLCALFSFSFLFSSLFPPSASHRIASHVISSQNLKPSLLE